MGTPSPRDTKWWQMNSGLPPSSVPAGGKLASSSGTRTQTCTKNHTHPPQCHRSCPGADRQTDPGSARNNQHKCSSHAATPSSARTQDKVQNPQPAQERPEPSPPAGRLPFTLGLGATPAAPPPRPSAAGATPAPLKGTRGPPLGCHLSRGVSTLPTRVDSSPARNESSALTPSPLFQPLSPAAPPSASETWQTPVQPSEHPSGVPASTKPPPANRVTPSVGPPLPCVHVSSGSHSKCPCPRRTSTAEEREGVGAGPGAQPRAGEGAAQRAARG